MSQIGSIVVDTLLQTKHGVLQLTHELWLTPNFTERGHGNAHFDGFVT